jgi:hypothetical protein
LHLKTLVAAAALAVLAGCRPEPHGTTLAALDGRNLATAPHDSLLPIGVFAPSDARLDAFIRGWYGRDLAAMKEPRLGAFVDSDDVEAVRFLWLRSFHHPIAVRAMRRGASYSLIAVELDGAGGYAPGAVFRRDSITLDSLNWNALVAPLGQDGFWQLDSARNGADGAEWVAEAATRGQLYTVTRWAPEATGSGANMRAFGLSMLRQTSLVPDPIY